MKKALLLIVLFFNFLLVFSQNENQAILQNAKEAYNSHEFKRYIDIISNYKNNNSSTPGFEEVFIQEKTEFQVMLIHSYIKTDDNLNAQKQIESFFKHYKDKSSESYVKVREYELYIEKENIEEDKLFNTIQSKKSSYYAYEYTKKYPNGKYITTVTDSLPSYNENDSWKYCIRHKEISDCQRHLKNHPNGAHSKEITLLLDSLEFDCYKKSINSPYPHVIKDYFRYFPEGKYDSLVREHYKSKLYENALRLDSDDMRTYIETFPNDEKTMILDSLLQKNYLTTGNSYFRKWRFNTASSIYSSYLQKYENGIYKSTVEKKLKRANFFGGIIDENGIKEFDYTYIMFNYDTEPSYGITISQLNNKKISFFYNFRFNVFDYETVTFNNNGTNSTKYDLITPTNDTRRDLTALSLGVKYNPISYPIWIYGAIGYEQYDDVRKYNCYNIVNGKTISANTQYFKTEKTKITFYPEIGVITTFLRTFTLKYGVMYNGKWAQQFGVGIMINNENMPSLIPDSWTEGCMNLLFIGWGN